MGRKSKSGGAEGERRACSAPDPACDLEYRLDNGPVLLRIPDPCQASLRGLNRSPAREEADHEQYQEEEEQHFGNSGGTGGNPGKSENGRDQRYHEECYGPVKHGVLLSLSKMPCRR
jgi:hypothetical protein